MGRNPIQNAGCYGILQSLQENPNSAIEALDFSVSHTNLYESYETALYVFTHFCLCLLLQDIAVNQDFEDLYTAVKETFPVLTVRHGGRVGTFRNGKNLI